MKNDLAVDINAGTIATMSVEQFISLRDNFCKEGNWDHVKETVRVRGAGDYIGVEVGSMFIGIERDGYTHS